MVQLVSDRGFPYPKIPCALPQGSRNPRGTTIGTANLRWTKSVLDLKPTPTRTVSKSTASSWRSSDLLGGGHCIPYWFEYASLAQMIVRQTMFESVPDAFFVLKRMAILPHFLEAERNRCAIPVR